jgi:hypothetical protein
VILLIGQSISVEKSEWCDRKPYWS